MTEEDLERIQIFEKMSIVRNGELKANNDESQSVVNMLRVVFPMSITGEFVLRVLYLLYEGLECSARSTGSILATYNGDAAERAYMAYTQEAIIAGDMGQLISQNAINEFYELLTKHGFADYAENFCSALKRVEN